MTNCIFLEHRKTKRRFMLSKKEQRFGLIFGLILVFELVSNQLETLSALHYAVKPLLLVSLIIFFFKESKIMQKHFRQLVLLALILSWSGDILLMFTEFDSQFFIFGLIAFLLAHVMYTFAFFKFRNRAKSPLMIIVALLIYASVLFMVLKDGLGEMLIPVLAYMMVILTMATSAYLRTDNVGKQSFQFVFIGALLFLISDSILALHKFHKPIILANISIMITYALAQFFIVIGILKQEKSQ